MIRRPPRSTRTAHSFPTRRSSDLLAASMDGRWRSNAMKRSWLKPISVGAVLLLAPAPAHAVAGLATTVLSGLTSLVDPAIAPGVIWLADLILLGRAPLLCFLIFLFGTATCSTAWRQLGEGCLL